VPQNHNAQDNRIAPLSHQPQFRQIDLAVDRDAVFGLTVEYMRWVIDGIEAHLKATTGTAPQPISVEDYVARTLDQMYGKTPPEGVFYLVEHGGTLAGMCGLRRIAPQTAEFKRIYVRPTHRGRHLGEAMLQRLIDDASAFGCDTAVLDSAPFMQPAHRLYAAAGFTDCPPYPGSEAPQAMLAVWRFMQRRL